MSRFPVFLFGSGGNYELISKLHVAPHAPHELLSPPKTDFNIFPRMFWSGILTVLELTRELGQEYRALDQIEATVSLWVNMPQFSKLKFMPFCNVHMKT
jgi:hypothetical protein